MRIVVLACCLWFTGCALAALPGVHEFRTAPEAIPDAELSALLDARVAGADVIAFGETAHGSAGFLRLQTRLIRYLVERHGLRLIVWETGVLRGLELTDWLAACTSTRSPPPLTVLYMPTAADRPLFEWLCAFNARHPRDPVVFRGIDVWDRPWEHHDRIASLGRRTGAPPALLKDVAADCPGARMSSWAEIGALYGEAIRDRGFEPAARYARCTSALAALARPRHDAPADLRPDAHELALSASTLLGWLGYYHYSGADGVASWNERDRAQGRNLELLMARHGAQRAIVAAHSSHVSHGRSSADWWGHGDLKSGVHFYARNTGRRVYALALTGYDVAGTQGHWSPPTAPDSMDRTLHAAGHRFAFFAADAPFLARHARWWMQNGNFPGPYESGVLIVPQDHFDAFLFFAESPLDDPLPARPIWEP